MHAQMVTQASEHLQLINTISLTLQFSDCSIEVQGVVDCDRSVL